MPFNSHQEFNNEQEVTIWPEVTTWTCRPLSTGWRGLMVMQTILRMAELYVVPVWVWQKKPLPSRNSCYKESAQKHEQLIQCIRFASPCAESKILFDHKKGLWRQREKCHWPYPRGNAKEMEMVIKFYEVNDTSYNRMVLTYESLPTPGLGILRDQTGTNTSGWMITTLKQRKTTVPSV